MKKFYVHYSNTYRMSTITAENFTNYDLKDGEENVYCIMGSDEKYYSVDEMNAYFEKVTNIVRFN